MMLQYLLAILLSLIMVAPTWAQKPFEIKPARKTVTLTGYTRSRTKMMVASEVGGKISRVNYDVGDVIGDKFFIEMDTTFIDFQIQSLKWNLKKLQITRSRMLSRVDYLDKEFKRIDRLHKGDRATEVKRDAAAEELDQASLELTATEVDIKKIKTELATLNERRRRHHIKGPRGWIVVNRKVEPGEIITAGKPLAQAADYTRLVVPLYVSGKELAAIHRQNNLAVTLDGSPATARLKWINPEFNEKTRKLAVELQITETEKDHRGGLLCVLTLPVETEGLMVPKAAVDNRFENPRVILKEDGRPVPVVILGENDDTLIIARQPHLAPGIQLATPKPKP